MIFIFCFLCSLSLGITLIFAVTPICLGFWVLIFSLFISIFCGCFYISWFGFIIFLIYIGGMLVMFSYFAAIQPNQDIIISKPLFYWFFIYILIPLNSSSFRVDLFNVSSWWITCMYYPLNTICIIFLGLCLFLALIRVVKVTVTSFSPLRPFS